MIQKTGISRFQSLFRLILSAIAVCLMVAIFTSDATCAEDDEALISLPAKKNETKSKAASSTQKKETASRSVAAETMLQGVFYDLRHMRNRQLNKDFPASSSLSGFTDDNVAPTAKIVQAFVNGPWKKTYDSNGRVTFPALNAFYSPANRAWISDFYIGDTTSETALQAFGGSEELMTNCWVCIYSGYVVAPFSGQFRFVGFGDDFLVVRFNQKIVFDYGRISATLGAALSNQKRSTLTANSSEQSQQPKSSIGRAMPTINKAESNSHSESFYSKNKLVIRSPEYMNTNSYFGSGLANGSIISVRQGEVIPIEFLVGDAGGKFNYVLFLERLDGKGNVLNKDKPLQLFRTSENLPPSFTNSSAVTYDKNSPIWKVVDAKGKSIPSHVPSTESKKLDVSKDTWKTSADASSRSDSVPESQPPTQSDPKPKKTISRTKNGNITTETIVEQNGDTTIETITTTEVNDDTTVETRTVTETKNGAVVKKTTSTTTTKTTNEASNTKASSSSASPSASKTSSGNKTDSSSNQEKYNPFGHVLQTEDSD